MRSRLEIMTLERWIWVAFCEHSWHLEIPLEYVALKRIRLKY
jgi:hypothetical protein